MSLKTIAALSLVTFALSAHAATNVDAKFKDSLNKIVPDSKPIKQDGSEFDVLTSKETVVEVELKQDGTIDEASGNAAAGGDVLIPGNGLMNLADAVAALKKAGKTATGEWSFKKSFTNGWVYEFDGTENGKDMEYAINAKDGKLVKDSRDLM